MHIYCLWTHTWLKHTKTDKRMTCIKSKGTHCGVEELKNSSDNINTKKQVTFA